MLNHRIRRVVVAVWPWLAIVSVLTAQPENQAIAASKIIHTVLNGLAIDVDSQSGNILKLAYPGPGTILETTAEKGRLLDLAYPLSDFEPFRLGSRYSTAAKVEATDKSVTIVWDSLGGSRPFPFTGKVAAVVRLLADPDGRSVTMNCTIRNQSQRVIPQVLFPDLNGFVPIAGPSETRFRSGGVVRTPFQDIKRPDNGAFYPDPGTSGDVEYCCKSVYDGSMLIRWFDFGSLNGGLSCWQRSWGYEPEDVAGSPLCRVRMELDEFETKLRLMWMHSPMIAPGGDWTSRDYVLTPHKCGWAKGIETYRQWVQKNEKRQFPVPKHIREGLGMRSVFMCNWQPRDGDRDVFWRFNDLPKVAEEAKRYGLTELAPWFWVDSFQIPLPPAFPHLGGEKQFAKAVADCKKLGVNVAPFVSVLVLANPSAARYGLGIGGVWTYHPEFLPKIGPFYAAGHNTGTVDAGCLPWQNEVLASCKRLIDEGIASICWDVYQSRKEEPNLYTLTRKIRGLAKQKDAESTFGGEALNNMEIESEYLDYTWNWVPSYIDCRAFTSALTTPRVNVNINHSVPDTVLCFMDNLFLNVMPRKTPYGVNGAGTIGQYPEFSKVLGQCAGRRRQFLNYFTDGTLIGECLLSQDCPQTHVTGYTLPGKALLLVLNQGDRRNVGFRCDLAPWLKSASGRYRVDCYDMDGRLVKTADAAADWNGMTGELDRNEVAIFEIKAQ
jgi:hypothetical protein